VLEPAASWKINLGTRSADRGKNVPGLENVAGLERLPARGAFVIALPMKIGGGSGGPLRIVALVPR